MRTSKITLMVSALLALLFSIPVTAAATENVIWSAEEFDNHCCR